MAAATTSVALRATDACVLAASVWVAAAGARDVRRAPRAPPAAAAAADEDEDDATRDEEPIHAPRFWRQVHRARIVLAAASAAMLLWGAATPGIGAPELCAWALTLVLDVVALGCRGAAHWDNVVHLAELLSVLVAAAVVKLAVHEFAGTARWAALAGASAALLLVLLIPGEPAHTVLCEEASESLGEEGAVPKRMRVAPTERVSSSLLASLYYVHCMRLMRAANRRGVLEPNEVPVVGRTLRAAALGPSAERRYARRTRDAPRRAAEPSLIRDAWPLLSVLIAENRSMFLAVVVLTIVTVVFYYLPVFCTRSITSMLQEEEEQGIAHGRHSLIKALPAVFGLFFSVLFSSTIQGHLWSLLDGYLNVRLSTQLSSMLYTKALRKREVAHTGGREQGERGENVGSVPNSQVLTLHGVDLKRVTTMTFHLFSLVNAPFELVLGGYFAYRMIGVSALVGLLSSALLAPAITAISRVYERANNRLMQARDRRISLLSECLLAIRMIKSQAWEGHFFQRVMRDRAEELHAQWLSFVLNTVLTVVMDNNPLMVTAIAFAFYTLVLRQPLTPPVAFTTLSVLLELRWTMTTLPETITNTVQTLISLRRMNAYLQSGEVDATEHKPAPAPEAPTPEPPTLALRNATVDWPREDTEPGAAFRLENVSITFPAGGCTLVCGRLGAGKSLLLRALLHEAHVAGGEVIAPRSPYNGVPADAAHRDEALAALGTPRWLRSDLVAYAPQSAYLINASVRDNILFGLPLGDGSRYRETLEACALSGDLAALEHGDGTLVGENGVGLSGGQKARVCLARAVYSRASVVLLDDVLSAVDAHTARHLHTRLLCGPLLEHRTLVLVSHNVQLVGAQMDAVVFLEHGRVTFQGSGPEFLHSEHFRGLEDAAGDETGEEERRLAAAPAPYAGEAAETGKEEERATGSIAFHVWATYARASGGWVYAIATLLLFVGGNLWEVVTQWWLREWTGGAGAKHSAKFWFGGYATLLLVGLAIGVARWSALYAGSLRASKYLFRETLERVLRAPLPFHDRTSRGRLLNRFGQDFEVVDSEFASACVYVVIYAMQVVATCVAMYLTSGWQFVAALLLLLPVYVAIGRVYVLVARDLQRLASTSRSPIVGAFSDAVSGVQVLRAFGAQAHFVRGLYSRLNDNNRFVWWNNQCGRWLSQTYNLVSAFLLLASCFLVLTSPGLSAASAGFTFSFLIELNFSLLIGMRMYAVLQLHGVAVERVVEYATRIEEEPPALVEPRPPASWPEAGDVRVEQLTMRYAPEAPPVLHDVSFAVAPRSKLAIVGPTGSGKSTLASAFLRFLEPAGGRIVIDGLDIASVGLEDLRSHLQLVPQDPVIMSGTVRSTLDMLHQFDDEQLLECLRRVQLIPAEEAQGVPTSPFANLDHVVAEGGANLSQGQRQLLCLARAILHRSRLVLFDEASSSIDYHTDELITHTIQDAFSDSTVITIAHRLRTIIDYDHVLFLEGGRVVEFGEPAALLDDSESRFYKLGQSAGRAEFAHLQRAARAARERRAAQSKA